MKLSTAFAVIGGNDLAPLPSLPPVGMAAQHLTAGIRQADGSIRVLATLNIEGIQFTAERRTTVIRAFQLIAAGIGEHKDVELVILDRQDAPTTITLA
jgi:hypothetical protein